MGNIAVYTWAVASTTALATSQTLAGAGALKLNGSLALASNISGMPQASIPWGGSVSRTVSLTSTTGTTNAGINVTVAGYYLGAAISQTITGPAGNATVYTTLAFDSVSSITVSGAATSLAAGSGTTGHTQWFKYDTYRTYPRLSVAVAVSGTINYSFGSTWDDVKTNNNLTVFDGVVQPQPDNADAFWTAMSSATTSDFAYIQYPIRYANITVNSSDTTGALTATFIQQGIK